MKKVTKIDDTKKAIMHTLISLCSKNCRMRFRRYSRFTSSSAFEVEFRAVSRSENTDCAGEAGLGEPLRPFSEMGEA